MAIARSRHCGAMRAPMAEFMHRQGGITTTSRLRSAFSAREIRLALEAGVIVRDARGCYSLPTALEVRRAANRLHAVAVGRSAAAWWGWKIKNQPSRPELAVPRGRRVSPADQHDHAIRWRTLAPEDVHHGLVTSPARTVTDCSVSLPFDEALAVADSALRAGHVTRDELLEVAERVKRSGRLRALRVAQQADGRSMNPFESVLRAVSLDVPGLALVPQLAVRVGGRTIHPDLADPGLRIVAEADSYEFHTTPRQIDVDCHRYTELTLDGWLVCRFSWPQTMHRQDWVRGVFARAVASRRTTTIASKPWG